MVILDVHGGSNWIKFADLSTSDYVDKSGLNAQNRFLIICTSLQTTFWYI